jgi:hypothetical protein
MAASKTVNVSFNTNASMASALSKGLRFEFGTIALDSEYPTGGESLTIFANTEAVVCQPRGGYVFDYDKANSKLLAYQSDNGNSVASGTVTPLVQVAASTDLSALSDVPYIAFGWS